MFVFSAMIKEIEQVKEEFTNLSFQRMQLESVIASASDHQEKLNVQFLKTRKELERRAAQLTDQINECKS